MLRRCLVIGSARNWQDDVNKACQLIEFEHFVVAKGAGCVWPGPIDAWVTLHNEQIEGHVKKRKEAGYPPAQKIYSWEKPPRIPCITHRTEFRFPGQSISASSGIFAAKVALIDEGFDRVILCGIPLDPEQGRIDYADPSKKWVHARAFFKGFMQALPSMKEKVRSMSGETQKYLGAPTLEWLNGMP